MMKTVATRKDAPHTIATSWSSSTRWRPCPPAAITTRTRESPACRSNKLGHNQGDATCRTMEPAIGTIALSSDTSDYSMKLSTKVDYNQDIMDLFPITKSSEDPWPGRECRLFPRSQRGNRTRTKTSVSCAD